MELTTSGKMVSNAARATGRTTEGMVDFLLSNLCDMYIDDQGTEMVRFMPPQTVGGQIGPHKSEVLVIGKMPSQEDVNRRSLQSGTPGDFWKAIVRTKGVNPDSWMLSNVVPFRVPDYLGGKTRLKEIFLKEGLPLLQETIQRVQPRYLLLFGADAVVAIQRLLGQEHAKANFTDLRGSILTLQGGIKAVCCIPPSSVTRDPAQAPEFTKDLELFLELITSRGESRTWETKCETISTFSSLRELIDQHKKLGIKEYSFDLEWGAHYALRTLQIAWSSHEGAVIHFARAGMVPTELGASFDSALELVGSLLRGTSLIGHNGRGDVQVLRKLGLDLLREFIDHGFDTMLAYHLVPGNETLDKQLELVSIRMLDAPRYDVALREWCKNNGINDEHIEEFGYGNIPDEILIPYGFMDALCTYRLKEVVEKELSKWPRAYDLYKKIIHPLNEPVLEMEETGIFVDQERLVTLTDLVNEKLKVMLKELQTDINWMPYEQVEHKLVRGKMVAKSVEYDGFNPNSPQQVCEVLYSRFKVKNGEAVRTAPPQAKLLKLTPVKATANDTPWEKVRASGKEHLYSPSTDSESLGILSGEHKLAKKIQQYKFVEQLRKTFLTSYEYEDGKLKWSGGIGASVANDGRAHTHFRLTLETGRYASSPNFQNFPKKQEKELIAIFTENGKLNPNYYSLRSVLMARPGHVLIEADWNQAELWTLGYCAKDEKFINVLKTSDVHTTMLRTMFGAKMHKDRRISEYTVEELNKLRKNDVILNALRGAAKTTTFGIPF